MIKLFSSRELLLFGNNNSDKFYIQPDNAKLIINNFGELYDELASAVDNINEVFSIQVINKNI